MLTGEKLCSLFASLHGWVRGGVLVSRGIVFSRIPLFCAANGINSNFDLSALNAVDCLSLIIIKCM